MIRGAIEMVRRTQISGWIFAEAGTINDQTVLAFSGDRCVGAGKIDRFRQDLLEAQLGDGHCGFEFPINLNEDETPGSVIVRLQNSDVALIQAHTKLIGPGEQAGTGADLGAIAPSLLPWMQDRGWLEQHEFDFLRCSTNGRCLRARFAANTRRPNAELPPALKPDHVVQELLSLFMLMGHVDVIRRRVISVSDLASAGLRRCMTAGVVGHGAYGAIDRCRIALEERSHVRAPGAAPGARSRRSPAPRRSIEYGFGPDRILFVASATPGLPRISVAPADGVDCCSPRDAAKTTVITLRQTRPGRLTTAAGLQAQARKAPPPAHPPAPPGCPRLPLQAVPAGNPASIAGPIAGSRPLSTVAALIVC